MKLLLENFRSFITEQESGLPQIYCDMDGVLVDFERGVVDQINKDLKKLRSMPDSKNLIKIEAALAKAGRKEVVVDDLRGKLETAKPVRDYMYGRVSDDATFWANLPWMPGGKELWAFIAPYHPHILTSGQEPQPLVLPHGWEEGRPIHQIRNSVCKRQLSGSNCQAKRARI